MSKITKILTIVIVLVVLGFLFLGMNQPELKNKLVSPGFSKGLKTSGPTISPPNVPKEIKFNRSTNLQAELEKVNPQVLDTDFE